MPFLMAKYRSAKAPMAAKNGISMANNAKTRLALGLLNVCTLMLAVPWTKTMYYTKWASKVEIDGKNLRFTGNAGSFFGVWLKTLALSTVTLSLYYWFIGRKNVARWVDSNIEWA